MQNHDKALIYTLFPQYLQSDIEQAIKIQPINKPINYSGTKIDFISKESEQVMIDSEKINTKTRIYFDEPDIKEEEKLNTMQKTILDCIYAYHHNGYIREKRVKKLLKSNHYFVIPFLLTNVAEYVIEILSIINKGINTDNIKLFKRFIQENPNYWRVSKDRIVSYWNEFYRREFPCFDGYIGSDFIKKIEG